MDPRRPTGLVFLAVSDMPLINHHGLFLFFLESFQILLFELDHYVNDGTQVVKVGDLMSGRTDIIRGVPQERLLGPMV